MPISEGFEINKLKRFLTGKIGNILSLPAAKLLPFDHNIISCIILLLVLTFPVCSGQPENRVQQEKTDTIRKKFSLFDSDEILEISIRFDLTGFLRKSKKEESFDGIMTIRPGEKDSIDEKINIKYRGVFRFENCSFPPMEINFKKPIYAYSDTGKIKKLKLVTRCDPSKLYDEYGLREYLVYKLYNVFTDTSFRVRLLRITFNDTRKSRKPVTQYGFFIEPLKILAGRINATVVKSTNLNQTHIVPEVMDRVAIFNYMIANWDWSVPGPHNINILMGRDINNAGLGLAVPFDFDLCGVVNADYSIPSEATGLKTARDRKFAGLCRSKEIFHDDLLDFLSKKEKLYFVINDFQYVSQKTKKDITSFLDQFFNQLEKQRNIDNLINNLLNNCK